MQVEIKNVRHVPDLSEGSQAFSATLYIDGKRAARVSNDGRGGINRVHAIEGQREAVKKLEAYLETLPELEFFGDSRYKPELDVLISHLVAADRVKKDVRRNTTRLCGPKSKKIAVLRKGENAVNIYKASMGQKVTYGGKPMLAEEAAEAMERDRGHDPLILNTVYASDPDKAFDYMLRTEAEAVKLVKWTLEDAISEARKAV